MGWDTHGFKSLPGFFCVLLKIHVSVVYDATQASLDSPNTKMEPYKLPIVLYSETILQEFYFLFYEIKILKKNVCNLYMIYRNLNKQKKKKKKEILNCKLSGAIGNK